MVGILYSALVFPPSMDYGFVEGTTNNLSGIGEKGSEVGGEILEKTKKAADKIREMAGLANEDRGTKDLSSDNQSANLVLLSQNLKKGQGIITI
ncbi:hypothetical protein BH18THE1_BH18THE1_19440 [soil metagenome]